MLSRTARRRLWRGTPAPRAWKRRVQCSLARIATNSGCDHRALRRLCKIVRCRKRPSTCTRSAGRLNAFFLRSFTSVCMPPISLCMHQHCHLQVARADHWHADWLKVSYGRRLDFLAFYVIFSTGPTRRHSRPRCASCLPKFCVIRLACAAVSAAAVDSSPSPSSDDVPSGTILNRTVPFSGLLLPHLATKFHKNHVAVGARVCDACCRCRTASLANAVPFAAPASASVRSSPR